MLFMVLEIYCDDKTSSSVCINIARNYGQNIKISLKSVLHLNLSPGVQEEEKSKDWADQVEEEATNEAKAFRSDIREALFKEKNEWSKEAAKDFVKGLKLWEDLKPRRVQALCACAGRNETQLSFKAGAVMDGARPAAWIEGDWLEATLDGRDGLVFRKYVEYLPDLPK